MGGDAGFRRTAMTVLRCEISLLLIAERPRCAPFCPDVCTVSAHANTSCTLLLLAFTPATVAIHG